jgi:hypothetical protein
MNLSVDCFPDSYSNQEILTLLRVAVRLVLDPSIVDVIITAQSFVLSLLRVSNVKGISHTEVCNALLACVTVAGKLQIIHHTIMIGATTRQNARSALFMKQIRMMAAYNIITSLLQAPFSSADKSRCDSASKRMKMSTDFASSMTASKECGSGGDDTIENSSKENDQDNNDESTIDGDESSDANALSINPSSLKIIPMKIPSLDGLNALISRYVSTPLVGSSAPHLHALLQSMQVIEYVIGTYRDLKIEPKKYLHLLELLRQLDGCIPSLIGLGGKVKKAVEQCLTRQEALMTQLIDHNQSYLNNISM